MVVIRTVDPRHRAKHMAKAHLKLVTPAIVNRTVTPRRAPTGRRRTRESMTEAEVERLMTAAKGNRYGHRDATMALVAYRHGLRASELVDLRWEQVDFRTASLHVRRVKQGSHINFFSDVRGFLQPAAYRSESWWVQCLWRSEISSF